MLTLVEAAQIPAKVDIQDVPDDLMLVYRRSLELELLCRVKKGVGISAVQAGIPWRLFVVDMERFRHFCNCEYTPVTDAKSLSFEGCLSLLDKSSGQPRQFRVERFNEIIVKGKELVTCRKGCGLELIDFESRFTIDQGGVVFQHEIDHQNGILISDIGQEFFVWS